MGAVRQKTGKGASRKARAACLQRLLQRLRQARKDEEGVTAIEMALLLPFLVMLLLGSVEMFLMSMASRKMTRVTNTVGDLITQSKTTLRKSTIRGYYRAARHIMGNFPTDRLAISVYTFRYDFRSKKPKLDWRLHLGNFTCRAQAPVLTADQIKAMEDGNDMVITYGCYNYKVAIGRIVLGDLELNMKDEVALRPRQRLRVPCSDCS